MGFYTQFLIDEIVRMEKKEARGCALECGCDYCTCDIQELIERDSRARWIALGIVGVMFIIGAILLINI